MKAEHVSVRQSVAVPEKKIKRVAVQTTVVVYRVFHTLLAIPRGMDTEAGYAWMLSNTVPIVMGVQNVVVVDLSANVKQYQRAIQVVIVAGVSAPVKKISNKR